MNGEVTEQERVEAESFLRKVLDIPEQIAIGDDLIGDGWQGIDVSAIEFFRDKLAQLLADKRDNSCPVCRDADWRDSRP